MDGINLSRQDISNQLKEIVQRQWPVGKKRQVDFSKIEILICYGLFYVIDPHHYGGGNMHTAPLVVHKLAAFFKRSASSLTSKMLNLDGSRKNSGKNEVSLFAQLSADPHIYRSLLKEIIIAARDLSIDDNIFPDFLGLLDEKMEEDVLLVGQEELPISSGQLLEKEQRLLEEVAENFLLGDELTERLVEQRVRLTQHRFALNVLKNCGRACVFCGFEPRTLLGRSGLLRASHIKPWSVSTSTERMDIRNGLAACPIHDVGFDQGYLTINEEYAILRSPLLLRSIASDPGVGAYFEVNIKPQLILPSQARRPDAQYIRYHQTNIFRN